MVLNNTVFMEGERSHLAGMSQARGALQSRRSKRAEYAASQSPGLQAFIIIIFVVVD